MIRVEEKAVSSSSSSCSLLTASNSLAGELTWSWSNLELEPQWFRSEENDGDPR